MSRKSNNDLSRGPHEAQCQNQQNVGRVSWHFLPTESAGRWQRQDDLDKVEGLFVSKDTRRNKKARASTLEWMEIVERDRNLQNRYNGSHMVILLCVSRRSGDIKTFSQFLKNNFISDFKIYVAYVLNWLNFKFLFHNIRFYLLS